MFAPSSSRPPYFTPHAQLVWPSDEECPRGVQRPRTAQSPPPFQTEPSTRPTSRRKRKAASQQPNKRATKLIQTLPQPALLAALPTHTLLHTLSLSLQHSPPPTQTALQSLYGDLLTVGSRGPAAQQAAGVGGSGRHRYALLLRLVLASVLWVEMQGKGKEELELVDKCCSHLAGLLVLSLNGRASQSDDSSATRAKRTERPNSGKPTVAEELHAYRTAMLERALPQCLHNNARTLYHISLVGVHTDWVALAALLPALPHLRHLNVQQCDIADEAASGVLSALGGSGVTHLSLLGNRLTDAVVHPLCRLILNQGLRREDIEWQWRLRLSEQQLPAQHRGRRRSDARANREKSDSIREQGLLSIDISGNCITDDGMLRLIDTLSDDCWLLAVLLHDNQHSERAVVAFFSMLAHNRTLLYYSIMPIPPGAPATTFPPSSPRSRPTSPRGVLSTLSSASSSTSSARYWSALSSVSDPHFLLRRSGVAERHSRQLLLCPRLSLNDQSAARFGHGMRGQRDVQIVAAAVEPNRLLAAVETARPTPWDALLRQKQEDMRSAQRSDSSRPTSATQSGRPLSLPAFRGRPSSAASSSAIAASRPASASPHIAPASRARPHTSANASNARMPPSLSSAARTVKPLPLALLDSLFKQLEAVDSAAAMPQRSGEHRNSAQLPLSPQPPAPQPSEQQRQPEQRTGGHKQAEQAEEAAGWKELRQWANEQQRKSMADSSASVESSGFIGVGSGISRGDGSVDVARVVDLEDRVGDAKSSDTHSLIRPSGQLLSLSDLLDDD